jgi:Flp pilus assembly protein TadB
MIIGLTLLLIAALLFLGLKTVCAAADGITFAGRGTIKKIAKWQKKSPDPWAVFPLKQLLAAASRLVYVDETAGIKLGHDLEKAGLPITPKVYTARKYLTVFAGIGLTAVCFILRFYFGVFVALLAMVFALMKQRDALNEKIRKKELAISQEMPRFVRTLCRSLQTDRDLVSVIGSYRKIAGPELGGELDILLAEMQSGNVQSALVHFENRIGSTEAFRLCGALRDMSMGIDQTAALSYMADDMARSARENIKRELSLRPGKMRRTYYPAIGVCIAMILYVLVVYVIHNLNNIV